MREAPDTRRGSGGERRFSRPEAMEAPPGHGVGGLCLEHLQPAFYRAFVLCAAEVDCGEPEEDADVVLLEMSGAADVGEGAAEISCVQAGKTEQTEVFEALPIAEHLRL